MPFDLPDFADAPLEIPEAPGMPAQPQAPTNGGQGRDLAMLIPLIAAAGAKGGRAGITGFLQGIQQARARKMQETRLGQQDARLAQQDQRLQQTADWQRQYQQGQLDQARERDKNALVKEFSQAMLSSDLKDDEGVRALLALYEPRAQAMGVAPGTLTSIAMQSVTPMRLQQNQINKRWAGMSAEEKKLAQQMSASLSIDGRVVPFTEWSAVVGGVVDPKTGAYPQAGATTGIQPDVPLDRQHAMALASGDTKTAALILQAMREQDAAKANPADPLLQEIRALTAANLRTQQAAVANGAMTPAQFQQAQALGNDYIAETKNFWTQRSAYQQVVSANPSQSSPAGHMALVFAYMKLLDPNSVVRETEYANAQNASAVPDRIRNIYNKVVDGAILTPRQIEDFRNQARQIYMGAKSGAAQVKSIYDQRATSQGLNPSAVTYMLPDPMVSETPTATNPAAVTPPTTSKATRKIGRFDVVEEP